MPWKEETTMSNRKAFVDNAKTENINISALCRMYGISRKTGYKWIKREREEGESGLVDQSRRPKNSPNQTPEEMEKRVLQIREKHPKWGGRKIRRVLQNEKIEDVPSASTITSILYRNEKIKSESTQNKKTLQRFERKLPNELWQMDFKGYFKLSIGGNCHPLTVIDDHSRFLVGLKACPNETSKIVKKQLSAIFEQFGLPDSMLMDNASQWSTYNHIYFSALVVWLMRLGISILHGRPHHPQTQGKDERLNRTLKDEVISQHSIKNLEECQEIFDKWQYIYNFIRPHDSLDLNSPHSRYKPSNRPFPTTLPPIIYEFDDVVRKVDCTGKISFQNHKFRIGKGFRDQTVALRSTEVDGIFNVFFCNTCIKSINLHKV